MIWIFFGIMLFIVLLFTHSAICADVFERKGYPKLNGALVGLLPVYGMFKAVGVILLGVDQRSVEVKNEGFIFV